MDASDGEPAAHSSRDSLTLVRKIVNNLQLSLTNLHVRYEDATLSSAPFAAGVTPCGAFCLHDRPVGQPALQCRSERAVQTTRAEGARGVPPYRACDKMLDPSIPMHQMAEWLDRRSPPKALPMARTL